MPMPQKLSWILILFFGVAGISTAFHALSIPWHVGYSDVAAFYYKTGPIEYPPITAGFIKLMLALGGGTEQGYYFTSVIGLAAVGMLTTWALYTMALESSVRRRLLLHWIFAPTMFVFLVYNWDVIALLFVVLAFLAMQKKRHAIAAASLALGASAKLFPALYVVPLLLTQKTLKSRLATGGVFTLTMILANAPFAIADFNGWSYFYRLNQLRLPNLDSVWGLLYYFFGSSLTASFINTASMFLFGAGAIMSLWILRRTSPIAQCFALTLLFLLTNKVLSPQYILWLLPFFVLLPFPSSTAVYGVEFSNIVVLFSALPVLLFAAPSPIYSWIVACFVIVRHIFLSYFFVHLHSAPARRALMALIK